MRRLVKAIAVLAIAAVLRTSTVPVAAAQTQSQPATGKIAASNEDVVDFMASIAEGMVEGAVAGAVAGAWIGSPAGALDGALAGGLGGAAASAVLYVMGTGNGDEYFLTGLPKGKKLPTTVLD